MLANGAAFRLQRNQRGSKLYRPCGIKGNPWEVVLILKK